MSAALLLQFSSKIGLAEDAKALKAVGGEITKELKAKMLPQDVATLRERYQEREQAVRA